MDWAGPGPTILVWAGTTQLSKQWRTLHCSSRTLEDDTGEEEKEEEEKRVCGEVLSFMVAMLWWQMVVQNNGPPIFSCFCIAFSFCFCSPTSIFLLLFLTVVVVLSMVAQGSFSSGNEGSQAGGEGFGSWRLRWRKRESREVRLAAEMRGEAGFFVDFGPNSPHLWIMKIKFLYR